MKGPLDLQAEKQRADAWRYTWQILSMYHAGRATEESYLVAVDYALACESDDEAARIRERMAVG